MWKKVKDNQIKMKKMKRPSIWEDSIFAPFIRLYRFLKKYTIQIRVVPKIYRKKWKYFYEYCKEFDYTPARWSRVEFRRWYGKMRDKIERQEEIISDMQKYIKDKQNEYLKFTREYYDFRLNTFVETQKLLANLSTLIEYVTNMKKEIK